VLLSNSKYVQNDPLDQGPTKSFPTHGLLVIKNYLSLSPPMGYPGLKKHL
jgi:hypothetical protein